MNEVREWKRVRVARWSLSNDVRVKTIRRVPGKYKDVAMQMMDQLVGVTVPTKGKYVTVMPMEYLSGSNGAATRQWLRCDPTRFYLLVPAQHLTVLGPAYDAEISLAKRGCRAHRLAVQDPSGLQLARLKARLHEYTLDEVLKQHLEDDERKTALRNRRSTK